MSTGASLASDMDLDTDSNQSSANVMLDRRGCIPLDKVLSEEDVVLLLTPVVIPPDMESNDASDPFEPLGQALYRRGFPVRHVPYTKTQGITGVHVAFIKRAKATIFVITGLGGCDGSSQLDLADMVGEICENRPLILLACCELGYADMHGFDFATVVRVPGFSKRRLAAAAALLLDGEDTTQPHSSPVLLSPLNVPLAWKVEPWVMERDIAETHSLWTQALPQQFHLDRPTLASLLKREGYALHYMVREPSGGAMVGFCATYTTFADSIGDQLVGSIAAIIVRKDLQGRGIGRALHEDALGGMRKVRGVNRMQLGSTFPRLLYGVPVQASCGKWLQDRGWTLDEPGPGKGRLVADWILRLSDLPTLNLASAGLSFRPCEITDVQEVLDMVSRESGRKLGFGWWDQYTKVLDSSYMSDVILGFEGKTLVATAVTYIPNSHNPAGSDLPWASRIGMDVGGVTCICIKDDDPEMVNRRDTVMVRMLQACCKSLSDSNMAGVFVDGVKAGERGFESLGFRKWAEYREVWKTV